MTERCDKTIDMFDYPIFDSEHVYSDTDLVIYKGMVIFACDARNRFYLEELV